MEQKKGNDAAEKRVTVMVACMVGAFMAAWTPYSILALFETFIGVADPSGGPGWNMSNTTLSLDGQQQFNDNQPTSNEADDSNFFYDYIGVYFAGIRHHSVALRQNIRRPQSAHLRPTQHSGEFPRFRFRNGIPT
jgi:hypothetical protein